ncbi:MAG: radical SAM protein [Candidatus Omnitrophota bacterium]
MHRLSFDKVYYHWDHLYPYLKTGDCYPIHMIVGLTNLCNHACIWCYAYDAISSHYNENNFASKDMIVNLVEEAARLGLKAITLVGTGEPTMHPHFVEIVKGIKNAGVDLGLFTNGSLLKGDKLQAILDTHTFMRVSVSAATAEEHNHIHHSGRQINDFDKIVENVKTALNKRNSHSFPTVGVQFSVNHHNWKSLLSACSLWKEIGVDYFEIKPVYKNQNVEEHEENLIPLDEVLELMKETQKLEAEGFAVYAKYAQFNKVVGAPAKNNRGYQKCHGQSFSTFFDPDGNLYICGNLHGQERFCIGNILKEGSFEAVWNGKQRKELLENLDVNQCPIGCRLDPLNLIIEDMINPDAKIHPNFV